MFADSENAVLPISYNLYEFFAKEVLSWFVKDMHTKSKSKILNDLSVPEGFNQANYEEWFDETVDKIREGAG